MVLLIYIDLTRPAFQEEKSSPSHLRVQQKAEPQRRSDVDHMAQFAGISLIVSLYNIYKYSTLNLQTPASKVQSATYNTLLGCVGIYTQPELTTFGVWQAMFLPHHKHQQNSASRTRGTKNTACGLPSWKCHLFWS